MRILKLALLTLIFGTALYADSSNQFEIYLSSERTNFEQGNPVEVSVTVKNVSGEKAEFNVFDFGFGTFQPIAYDMDGREAETKVFYRLQNRPVSAIAIPLTPRVVAINPGESFTAKMDLLQFYKLDLEKKYKVRGFFLPDARNNLALRSDNTIYIKINERRGEVAKYLPQVSQQITPSEIVLLFLNAEKAQRWSDFIKYVNVEKYIQSYSEYAPIYNRGDDATRNKVIKDFTSYLTTARNDYIIDFQLLGEENTDNPLEKAVTVKVKRFGGYMPYYFRYRYKLEQYGTYWRIIDVVASVTREK